ncbi:MAG: CcmD family protein [Bacteroidota bacterium]|nr:CcmD family protein [Bacteroidota bacterium]
MNKLLLKRTCFTLLFFLSTPFLWAQTAKPTTANTIDETMRSHDKIYVVMTVCIVILFVLFLYLIRIDSKVSKKEKSA